MAGVAIDYSTDSVPDNPFKFEKTYSWLKVGDTISQDKNGYERVETWWGSEEEWEQKFYGPDGTRWKVRSLGD